MRSSVSLGAERGDRVGRRAEIHPHLRAQWPDVAVVCVHEDPIGRQDVARELRPLERGPVDEQRLRIRLLQIQTVWIIASIFDSTLCDWSIVNRTPLSNAPMSTSS